MKNQDICQLPDSLKFDRIFPSQGGGGGAKKQPQAAAPAAVIDVSRLDMRVGFIRSVRDTQN